MRKLIVVLTSVMFAATCMAQGRGGSRGSFGGGRSSGGGGFSSGRSFSGGIAGRTGRDYAGGYGRGYRGRGGGSYRGGYYGRGRVRSFGFGFGSYDPWHYGAGYYPSYYDYGYYSDPYYWYDPYAYDPYGYYPYAYGYSGYYAAPVRVVVNQPTVTPAGGTGAFEDPIAQVPGVVGTHHVGASTEQAQEAIAEEAIRIIETFIRTGTVLNCVNLAARTPAKWQLIVRHYDRVGVLAFVMDQVRRAGINIEEVQNIIFEGAAAASCRIQLDTQPRPELLTAIQQGNSDIISLQLLLLGR